MNIRTILTFLILTYNAYADYNSIDAVIFTSYEQAWDSALVNNYRESMPLIEIPIELYATQTSDPPFGWIWSNYEEIVGNINRYFYDVGFRGFRVFLNKKYGSGKYLLNYPDISQNDGIVTSLTNSDRACVRILVNENVTGASSTYMYGFISSSGHFNNAYYRYYCDGGRDSIDFPQSWWAHELGHAMGLRHTFGAGNDGLIDLDKYESFYWDDGSDPFNELSDKVPDTFGNINWAKDLAVTHTNYTQNRHVMDRYCFEYVPSPSYSGCNRFYNNDDIYYGELRLGLEGCYTVTGGVADLYPPAIDKYFEDNPEVDPADFKITISNLMGYEYGHNVGNLTNGQASVIIEYARQLDRTMKGWKRDNIQRFSTISKTFSDNTNSISFGRVTTDFSGRVGFPDYYMIHYRNSTSDRWKYLSQVRAESSPGVFPDTLYYSSYKTGKYFLITPIDSENGFRYEAIGTDSDWRVYTKYAEFPHPSCATFYDQ